MTNENRTTAKIVMTAMMMCLVIVMTMVIRVPVPATQGYIHLGDCMIFFSVMLLGWKWGAVAAGVGSALADLFAGYASFIIPTLIIKGLMAVIMGLCIEYGVRHKFVGAKRKVLEIVGMILAGIFMVAGYYIVEVYMLGSFVSPIAAIPMNVVQFCVGMVLASALTYTLSRTTAGKFFEYSVEE